MQPLKISILTDADEHFIYRGILYIVLSEGRLIAVRINEIYEMLESRYPNYINLIRLAFRRNSFWNSEAAKCFLGIDGVQNSLRKAWSSALKDIDFTISLEDLNIFEICKKLPDAVLQMEAYANRLYLACLHGFYTIDISNVYRPGKITKRFDNKTFHVSLGYGEAVLSLGNDGYTNIGAFTDDLIKDKAVREGKSFSSNWTNSGGLMNYTDNVNFQFIGNKIISKKDVENIPANVPDRFVIDKNGFAVNIIDNFKIRFEENKRPSKFALSFNNSHRQLFVTNNGNVFSSNINVRDQKLSGFTIKNYIRQKVGIKPISGLTIAERFPVIEFDESVVLLQDKTHVLEEEGIVSMHTYPRSIDFRDIVSITLCDSINIHAIDLFYQDTTNILRKVEKKRFDKPKFDGDIDVDKFIEIKQDFNVVNDLNEFPF